MLAGYGVGGLVVYGMGLSLVHFSWWAYDLVRWCFVLFELLYFNLLVRCLLICYGIVSWWWFCVC